MENFLQNQRGDVFSGVALLVYVFDIESRDFPRDLETFRTVLDALYDGSRDARLFCLMHKMDLVQEDLRESLFVERESILRQVCHRFNDIVVLGTSIWDETLYKVTLSWAELTIVGMVLDRSVADTEHGSHRNTFKVFCRVNISRGSSPFRAHDIPRRRTRLQLHTKPSPRPATFRKSLLNN